MVLHHEASSEILIEQIIWKWGFAENVNQVMWVSLKLKMIQNALVNFLVLASTEQ